MKDFIIILSAVLFLSAVNSGAQERSVSDYSLRSLQTYQYRTSPVTIERLAFKNNIQYAYNAVYTSMGLTVSARLSVPAVNPQNIKGIIIMLRGHQRPDGYYTGKGTENPARRYLQSGWAVIAPDFLGYGSSSPAPSPSLLHQFYSTINAVELYNSLLQPVFNYSAAVAAADRVYLPQIFNKIVMWGHSNGGQAAIHFLEIIQRPVTTVLWAPVGLPFPDSAGHYGRGAEWLNSFKRDYTAGDFSLLNFLDKIAPQTRILLHQGDNDRSVPKAWNDALVRAITEENARRDLSGSGRINLRYEVYTGADHNINPYWDTVIPRDIEFWEAQR